MASTLLDKSKENSEAATLLRAADKPAYNSSVQCAYYSSLQLAIYLLISELYGTQDALNSDYKNYKQTMRENGKNTKGNSHAFYIEKTRSLLQKYWGHQSSKTVNENLGVLKNFRVKAAYLLESVSEDDSDKAMVAMDKVNRELKGFINFRKKSK